MNSKNCVRFFLVLQVEDILEPFRLSKDRLSSIQQRLLSEMEAGLSKPDATVRMLPTYVHELPDGSEKGKFLALDLGGSNFRVLLITLDGRKYEQLDEPRFEALSNEVKATTQEALFDHIASCLQEFVEKNGITEKLPLGFTFSFPVLQTGLTQGSLISWTKGFAAKGAEGADIIQLLREALARRQVSIRRIMCIFNISYVISLSLFDVAKINSEAKIILSVVSISS